LNFKDRITGDLEDLAFNLREKEDDQLEEVREAWLETNGKLSLVRRTDSKPVQKQELRLLG
jgi:uncharacterized membrane protein YcaP (DUF421 family)